MLFRSTCVGGMESNRRRTRVKLASRWLWYRGPARSITMDREWRAHIWHGAHTHAVKHCACVFLLYYIYLYIFFTQLCLYLYGALTHHWVGLGAVLWAYVKPLDDDACKKKKKDYTRTILSRSNPMLSSAFYLDFR